MAAIAAMEAMAALAAIAAIAAMAVMAAMAAMAASICIQISKRKTMYILAEMLQISKSWRQGSLLAHYHYKSSCRS